MSIHAKSNDDEDKCQKLIDIPCLFEVAPPFSLQFQRLSHCVDQGEEDTQDL